MAQRVLSRTMHGRVMFGSWKMPSSALLFWQKIPKSSARTLRVDLSVADKLIKPSLQGAFRHAGQFRLLKQLPNRSSFRESCHDSLNCANYGVWRVVWHDLRLKCAIIVPKSKVVCRNCAKMHLIVPFFRRQPGGEREMKRAASLSGNGSLK